MTCPSPKCGHVTPHAASYCSKCNAPLGNQAQVERRQLSILYCDVVGSTQLTRMLDPEEGRDIILSFRQICAEVIRSFDGQPNRPILNIGDAVQVYFGYPRTTENIVETAVLAGLAMKEAIAKIKNPLGGSLRVRIALATGLVVVGDIIDDDFRREYIANGEPANVAAHLLQIAEPDMVIIANETRQLVGQLFHLRDLGLHTLKNERQPSQAWAVLGSAPGSNRFARTRKGRSNQMWGRQREADVLLNLREKAWGGSGQAVLISGEAGMGKSHLADWLAQQPSDLPFMKLQYQCSSYHEKSPLHPVIAQLIHAAGLERTDAPPEQLAKLESLLALAIDDPAPVVPLFASLLSIPCAEPWSASSAQQRRLALDAMLDQLRGLARQRPVLIIFEDLHWADASSVALIDEAIVELAGLPVLMVLTSRLDFTPPWAMASNITNIPLDRLEPVAVRAMIECLCAPHPVSEAIIGTIADRADGIPLFAGELTTAALAAREGTASGAAPWPDSRSSVPASLHDALVGRLDRLPSKEIAQIGAVIGREFTFNVLLAVSGRKKLALLDELQQLEQADLIQRRDGIHAYRFKHTLIQEAAYNLLLLDRRRSIHSRIADTLIHQFPGKADMEPEVVAHHLTMAKQFESAVTWWHKGGQWAMKRSAYIEAASHLSKAQLAMAQHLASQATPASAQQRQQQLDLQLAYGQVMLAMHGYASPQSAEAFKKARMLAEQIPDVFLRYAIYAGQWSYSHIRGELTPQREMAQAFLQDVQAWPAIPEAGIAQRLAGSTCAFEGQFALAKTHLESALGIYDMDRDRQLAERFGHDPGVAAECYLALSLLALGEVERATRLSFSALVHALESDHPPTIAYGHSYRCIFEALCDNPSAALPHAQAVVELGGARGMNWWAASGTFYRGWSLANTGRFEEGMADMHQSLLLCRGPALGLPAVPTLFEALLAFTEARMGSADRALDRLDQALASIQRTGEHWIEAEVHRRRAGILLTLHPDQQVMAEEALHRAMDVARAQQARTFQLRAALDLAKLPGRQHSSSSLRRPLRSVCRTFDEHDAFTELLEARALLSTPKATRLKMPGALPAGRQGAVEHDDASSV